MPRGPFGFPRVTDLGPFVEETKQLTEEELNEKWGWEDCRSTARDEVDKQICREIKKRAIELLEDPDVGPPVDNLEDINSGFCEFVSESINELALENQRVRVLEDGSMNTWHYWIEYKGRHFDAEVPTGVDKPHRIPFFERLDFKEDEMGEEYWKVVKVSENACRR